MVQYADLPLDRSFAALSDATRRFNFDYFGMIQRVSARLSVSLSGYLALRGMKPPTPYLHHDALM